MFITEKNHLQPESVTSRHKELNDISINPMTNHIMDLSMTIKRKQFYDGDNLHLGLSTTKRPAMDDITPSNPIVRGDSFT